MLRRLAPRICRMQNQRLFSAASKHPLGLSQSTVDIVKSTAPVFQDLGYTITRTMYKNMFRDCPHVKEMFNQAHQVELRGEQALQPISLASSVYAYAKHIDDPSVLTEAIMRIAHKHVSLNVVAPQYDVVGEQLLRAVKEVLKDAATPQIMEAWGEAYKALAKVFIDVEGALIKAGQEQAGGWKGWRDFVVKEKIKESSNIYSFILEPADGKQICLHKPGQYVGLNARFGDIKTTRNYTISCKPNHKFFRLTIKKEGPAVAGAPEGVVSTHLHSNVKVGDTVQLSVPCGDFFLDTESVKPVALISGGVGLTPNLSILEQLVATNAQQHITFLMGIRNADVEPMHEYLSKIRRRNLNVKVKFIYDDPPNGDYPAGPISIEQVKQAVPHLDSEYYLCGPPNMMSSLLKGLQGWGVPADQIHHEFFGPFHYGR